MELALAARVLARAVTLGPPHRVDRVGALALEQAAEELAEAVQAAEAPAVQALALAVIPLVAAVRVLARLLEQEQPAEVTAGALVQAAEVLEQAARAAEAPPV
jgi:hypothetical protein